MSGSEREKPPPPLDNAQLTTDRIVEFYNEAARRLPLANIPELAGCINAGGLCLGLADPVTNIVLNTVALLPLLLDDGRTEQRIHRPTSGWFQIASRSRYGLAAFMTAYFRYLRNTQGRRYLHVASYNLPLAINLVHHDSFLQQQGRRSLLLPDGGKLREALRVAADLARHPAPDVLARLMTAQYPSDTLAAVLAKLRRSDEVLTAGDVRQIRDLVTHHQRSVTPLPASILDLWCRPVTSCPQQGGDDKTLLRLSTSIGEGLVAHISIERSQDDHQLAYIPDLPLSFAAADSKLQADDTPLLQTETDEVDHIVSLKLCLLDTIHAFYINVLARVPTSAWNARLCRALFVAGHCYGPMDPVSNIILSTVWYDIAFGADVQQGPQEGLLSTRPLTRMVSRSLAGLVAIVSLPTSKASEHQALNHINASGCDLSSCCTQQEETLLAAAAKAAKHPQPDAFVTFLTSLPVHELAGLLGPPGTRIRDADWDKLNNVVRQQAHGLAPMTETALQPKESSPSGMFQFPSPSFLPKGETSLSFVRAELDKVLREYCRYHPWEPSYQVDIICGVEENTRTFHSPTCYHVNFLASTRNDDATTLPRARTLFFAEFWKPPSSHQEDAQPSICCPVSDYFSSTGRCSLCEQYANMIVHPPSGGHSWKIEGFADDLYRSAVRSMQTHCSEELKGSDKIYFDPARNVEPPKITTDSYKPVTPWVPRFKPSSSRPRNREGSDQWLYELPDQLFF